MWFSIWYDRIWDMDHWTSQSARRYATFEKYARKGWLTQLQYLDADWKVAYAGSMHLYKSGRLMLVKIINHQELKDCIEGFNTGFKLYNTLTTTVSMNDIYIVETSFPNTTSSRHEMETTIAQQKYEYMIIQHGIRSGASSVFSAYDSFRWRW